MTATRRHLVAIGVGLVAIGLIWFVPDPRTRTEDAGLEPVTAARGVVVLVDEVRFDQSDPVAEPEGDILVRVEEGPRAGEELRAFSAVPATFVDADAFAPGDEVIVTYTDAPEGPIFVSVAERWRLPVLALLVLLFCVAIAAIAGWHGVRALIALGLTIVVTVKLFVPGLAEGIPPVTLAVVVACALTATTVVLSEGLGRTSLAAIVGAFGGLGVTAVLAAIVGRAAAFDGAPAGELAFFELSPGVTLDLRGLLLAAIIVGTVGVLDDMSVTQAATVSELAARSGLRGRALFASAFRLGRSHIAATVNTLFMAYVGAALPTLVLLAASTEPTLLTLNREVLALEIVRTLTGSLGIVIAMPLTTAIAALLVGRR
jgi:uncharacterized membrane protein